MRRAALVLVAACRLDPHVHAPSAPPGPHLVVSERGADNGRLVIVGENGERITELTRPGVGEVDVNPAFSPDGQWIVFASSRDRTGAKTSLWVVAARAKAEPVRITDGDAADLTPTWTPDGRALVFASNRQDGLDLWQQALVIEGDAVRADGAPVRLTELPGQEVSPSVASDGRIAFTEIADGKSTIAVRGVDGEVSMITSGPADAGPAWSPDGKTIAFTAPHLRPGDRALVDGDLYVVPAGGGTATIAADVPNTDEAGPAWSADGRWLFATSIYRRPEDNAALFSSIVYVDREAPHPAVHMLYDVDAPAVPRLAIAVARAPLDGDTLAQGPAYRDTLTRILNQACGAECSDR